MCNVILFLLWVRFLMRNITRHKDFLHFYKWRVPISLTGGEHISCSLKRYGLVFAKNAKTFHWNLVIRLKEEMINWIN